MEMKSLQTLKAHLAIRLDELTKAKEDGRTIIGYTPTGYCPEEFILATGAIPVGYIFGGSHEDVSEGGKYNFRWFDPFWLSQISLFIDKRNPYYNLADLTVSAAGDQHQRCFSQIIDYYAPERPDFYVGVPHTKQIGTKEYYAHGLRRLKKWLEEKLDLEITDDKLKEAIALCNKERALFDEIRAMWKEDNCAVTGKDYMMLQYGSHLLDKNVMIGILEEYIAECKTSTEYCTGPRIFVTGTGIPYGDTKLLDSIEKAGGRVIYMNMIECVRPVLPPVCTEGDLIDNFAQAFFVDRVATGWHHPVDEYIDNLTALVKEYKSDAVIWYQGRYRESYRCISTYAPDKIKRKAGVDMLFLETYYEPTEIGPMELRIKCFIDLLEEV